VSYDPPGAASGVPVYTDGSNAMAADLDIGTNKIINLVDPVTDQQAATKKYVDDNSGGVTDVQAAGYWSPLTNGDPGSPELVFDGNGDTVSVWTGA
jgi:hypothetical protein